MKITTECCTNPCNQTQIEMYCCDDKELVDFVHNKNEPYYQILRTYWRILFLFI